MKVLIKSTNKVEEVNSSYATNFLIPKGLAVPATDRVLAHVAQEEAHKQQVAKDRDSRQQQLAQDLQGKTITITTTANSEGELYGSIGKPQVKKALGVKDPLDIKLSEAIKRTGMYPIDLKVGKYRAKITLSVVAS